GVNQFGERFGLHLLDPLAGGSGAHADRDGIDAGGPPWVPKPGIADVEANEQGARIRSLRRRLTPASGGPGARRGGRAAEVALTLSVSVADALVMMHGNQVPNSIGQFGGLPGATVSHRIGRGALGGAGSWEELGPKPGRLPMTEADVYEVSWQGGGGVGDPLDRDPDSVARDVREGIVSGPAARAGAVRRPFDLEALPGCWRLHERLAATAYYCPGTGTLLALDIDEKGADPRDDIRLDLLTAP